MVPRVQRSSYFIVVCLCVRSDWSACLIFIFGGRDSDACQVASFLGDYYESIEKSGNSRYVWGLHRERNKVKSPEEPVYSFLENAQAVKNTEAQSGKALVEPTNRENEHIADELQTEPRPRLVIKLPSFIAPRSESVRAQAEPPVSPFTGRKTRFCACLLSAS